jgi:oxygen-independent coproporphyrinogen-3 oxidase
MEKDLSLYVHIPFCERKCLYCDFLSFNAEKSMMKEYFQALENEIILSSAKYQDFNIRSIFFGGGTPSFPDSDMICRILQTVRERFMVAQDAEISIEVNPASAIMDKLLAFREAGFNRLSIGAQSLNDEELIRLGRLHDSRMFYETYENAQAAGFGNINVDVMSALPGQTLRSYLETLSKISELKPKHISAYSLIVEEGTPFFEMKLDLPEEDEDRAMYHETKRILSENGYHRYEISNYAFGDGKTYECFHNKVYWRRGNYLGLGLGASSMVRNIRWKNTGNLSEYMKTYAKERDVERPEFDLPEWAKDSPADQGFAIPPSAEDIERLDERSQMEEFMFLGLRLVKGVSMREFRRQFGQDMFLVYGEVIDKYTASGHLETAAEGDDTYLRLSDPGLDVSNTIMAEFLF